MGVAIGTDAAGAVVAGALDGAWANAGAAAIAVRSANAKANGRGRHNAFTST